MWTGRKCGGRRKVEAALRWLLSPKHSMCCGQSQHDMDFVNDLHMLKCWLKIIVVCDQKHCKGKHHVAVEACRRFLCCNILTQEFLYGLRSTDVVYTVWTSLIHGFGDPEIYVLVTCVSLGRIPRYKLIARGPLTDGPVTREFKRFASGDFLWGLPCPQYTHHEIFLCADWGSINSNKLNNHCVTNTASKSIRCHSLHRSVTSFATVWDDFNTKYAPDVERNPILARIGLV